MDTLYIIHYTLYVIHGYIPHIRYRRRRRLSLRPHPLNVIIIIIIIMEAYPASSH
jgi:hypothetical protein